jgi:hypothetical protein
MKTTERLWRDLIAGLVVAPGLRAPGVVILERTWRDRWTVQQWADIIPGSGLRRAYAVRGQIVEEREEAVALALAWCRECPQLRGPLLLRRGPYGDEAASVGAGGAVGDLRAHPVGAEKGNW